MKNLLWHLGRELWAFGLVGRHYRGGLLFRVVACAAFALGLIAGARAAGPTITWELPNGGSTSTVEHLQTFRVTAQAHDPDGDLAYVSIDRNGVPFAYAGGGDGYDGDSTNESSHSGPTTVTFTAWATDWEGTESPRITHTVTVKAPKAVPTITWDASMPTIVQQWQTFNVRANAQDADGNIVTVNIYRQDLGTWATQFNGTQANAYASQNDTLWQPRGSKIVYTARAKDSDEQWSTTIVREVHVAYVNTDPSATLSPSLVNTYISANFSFAVSASDPHNDLSKVELFEWAWEQYGGVYYAPRQEVEWKQTWTSSGPPINTTYSRPAGTFWRWRYEYMPRAHDIAGAMNPGPNNPFFTRQTTVNVDNHPPMNPTMEPIQSQIVIGQQVCLTGSTTDQDGNLSRNFMWYQYLGPNGNQPQTPVKVPQEYNPPLGTGTGSNTLRHCFTPTQVGKYKVWVHGFDPYSPEGMPSQVEVFWDMIDVPPTAPANVRAGTISYDRVQVMWDPTGPTPTNRVGYYLYYGVPGGPVTTATLAPDATSEWVPNLNPTTNYNFYLKAYNSFGTLSPSSNVLNVTTTMRWPVITSGINYTIVQGNFFNYQITATENPTSFSAVADTNSSFPPGIAFNGVSTISGTCNTPGTYKIRLTAKNDGGWGNPAILTINVTGPPPVINSPLEVAWARNATVNYQITANPGATSYGAAPEPGSILPIGVVFSAQTGAFSGIPTDIGTNYVRISATNSGGTDYKILKITVADMPIIYSSLQVSARREVPFSYQIAATNAPTSYTLSGTLPTGLSFGTKSGVISGEIAANAALGPYSLTISAINAVGSDTKQLTLAVEGQRPVITSPSYAFVNRPASLSYRITAKAPAADGPISYSAADAGTGVLPGNLQVNSSTGDITGGYVDNGIYYLKIRATNAVGTGEKLLRIAVDDSSSPNEGSSGTPLAAALPGDFSVDNKGAANYTIPLELPRGRSGLEPKLSVGYNSGGGNGVLGIGYHLSTGFPREISRGRNILARDGSVRGINFDAADKLYLDGKRLVWVSGSAAGTPGSVYRTEVDSFVTVTAYGSSEIDGFKLVAKDGTIMFFGRNSSEMTGAVRNGDAYHIPAQETVKALSWALKWVEDPIGNYIEFCYDEGNLDGGPNDFTLTPGEHLLTSIRYTGKKGLEGATPRYVVWLRHNKPQNQSNMDGARPDETTQYQAGRFTLLSARLDEIAVVEGDYANPHRSFQFKFDKDAGMLRLVEVMRRDGNGAGAKTVATKLQWLSGAPALTAMAPQDVYTSALETNPSWTGDFNGDGRQDILFKAFPQPQNTILTSLTIASRAVGGSWTDHPITFANSFTDLRLVTTGDFDGDGRTDLVWVKTGKGSLNGGWYISLATTPASGIAFAFGAPQRIVANTETNDQKTGADSSALALDLDGDGRDEFLYASKESVGNASMAWLYEATIFVDGFMESAAPRDGGSATILPNGKLYIARRPATGSGLWPEVEIASLLNSSVPTSLRKIDLDGDGRADLLATEVNVPTPKQATNAVDVGWTVKSYRNTGTTISPTGALVPTFTLADTVLVHDGLVSESSKGGHVTLTGDVNGDGLEDLVNYSDADEGWLVALSKGDGTFEKNFGKIPLELTDGTKTYFHQPGTILVVANESYDDPGFHIQTFDGLGIAGALLLDANGDGRKDFVWYAGSAGWKCFLAGRAGFDTTASPLTLIGAPTTDFTYEENRWPGVPELMSEPVAVDGIGDGRESMLMLRRQVPGQYSYKRAALPRSATPYLFRLNGATDALDAKFTVQYGPISDTANYTSGASVSYPIREVRRMTVVTSVAKEDGTGPNQQFSYQYSGARTDLYGRGFLGFHSFVTLDWKTKIFKYQFLAQSFPMTGLTHRDETYRWLTAGEFRVLSSHDNTVVFDEVVNPANTSQAWGTVFPFISKAVESRWENSDAAHFTVDTTNSGSQAEALFPKMKPSTEPEVPHIVITASSWFDLQTGADPQLANVSPFFASDTSGSANVVTGALSYTTLQDPTKRKITYGNLTKLKTDFGDGHSEEVVNAYYTPAANGPAGLVQSVTTTARVAGQPDLVAPVKRYTYWRNTALVATEKIDSSNDNLDLTTTYTRDERGRVTTTTISGLNNSGSEQHIGEYVSSEASNFDAGLDLPGTTKNAAPHSHATAIVYHPLFGLPEKVTDMENGSGTDRPETRTLYDALGRAVEQTDVFKGLKTSTSYRPTGTASDPTQTVKAPTGHTGSSLAGVVGLDLDSAYVIEMKQTLVGSSDAYAPVVWSYYDRLGRLIRTVKENFTTVSDPTARTKTDTAYNNMGQIIAVSLPYTGSAPTHWTTTTYDVLGRVSNVTAPNGTETTTVYKGRATIVKVDAKLGTADPLPQVNATVVDVKGRTVKVWNPEYDNDPGPSFSDMKGNADRVASITFTLDGFGRMKETALKGQTATIKVEYDELGRQTKLDDPDKGVWTYVNNAFGQVVKQTDARLTVTKASFDRLGRPLVRTTTEAGTGAPVETAKWFYYDRAADTAWNLTAKGTGGWIGAAHYDEVTSLNAPGYVNNRVAHVHFYDSRGRPEIELSQIDGQHFYTKTKYDAYSRPETVWPAWRPDNETPTALSKWGYNYGYNTKGYIISVTDTDARSWWSSPVYDHRDRVQSAKKGSYYTQRTYRAADGVITAIRTGTTLGTDTLQNLTFDYDRFGNLISRTRGSVTETFSYDWLNRLETSSKQGTTTYLANGNIDTKPDVTGTVGSAYTYMAGKPHAVQTARGITMDYDANGNMKSRTSSGESWNFVYAGFDKPRWMARIKSTGTVGSEFVYDAARSRVMHLEFDSMAGITPVPLRYKYKKIYSARGGAAEVDYKLAADGASWTLDRTRLYVPAPDGTAGAMTFKTPTGVAEAQVYHHDHLGSIDVITLFENNQNTPMPDLAGRPSLYSFDAWGERRNPATWTGRPTTATTLGGHEDLTPRGYTGHEMLDDLGLVHMNGRIYDPLLGRMISADSIVPGRTDLQAYNRYSYVVNNPLRYTDPDGEAPKDVAAGIEDAALTKAGTRGLASAVSENSQAARNMQLLASVQDFFGFHKAAAASRRAAEIYNQNASELDAGIDGVPAEVQARSSQRWNSQPDHSHRIFSREFADNALTVAEAAAPVAAGAAGRSPNGSRLDKAKPQSTNSTQVEPNAAPTGDGCFVAGTLIATENGLVPIERVKAGMRVWSRSSETGAWEIKPVAQTFVHQFSGDLITITIGSAAIQASGNHPFWVELGVDLPNRPVSTDVPLLEGTSNRAGRWVAARDLRVGDVAMTLSAGRQPIQVINSRHTSIEVYNFEVEENHTYAVGPLEVLVHNKPAFRGFTGGAGRYSHLKEPNKVGPGLKTTPAQRARILNDNKEANDGVMRSDQSGVELTPPKALKPGEKRPANEANVDHMEERSEGGSNSNTNQRVISFEENLQKELERRRQLNQ